VPPSAVIDARHGLLERPHDALAGEIRHRFVSELAEHGLLGELDRVECCGDGA